jgi:DNA-binding beta-propeller fold protein YncE
MSACLRASTTKITKTTKVVLGGISRNETLRGLRVLRGEGFLAVVALALVAIGLSAQTAVPEIAYQSQPNLLKMPADIHLGEAAGVATNSKGHLFVYTRTGNPTAGLGNSRVFTRGGARLFEFDRAGAFVREIGQGVYSFLFAHAVRVDAQDNIWIVDEAANQVIKFSPDGRVLMVMGRKPEAITVRPPPAPPAAAGEARGAGAGAAGGAGRGGAGRGGPPGAGGAGDQFSRPSDVAWDAAGNIFVADGHGNNARVAKFDRNGRFLLSFGSRGSEPGQFNTPHSIATDLQGNVYVADLGNNRIQVFDNQGAVKAQLAGVGTPTAICISRGAHPYLFSAHTGDRHGMDDAAIYKLELDGRIVGKFGKAGKLLGEFGLVNAIDCRTENELYIGELSNWRVQKLTLRR